MLACEAWNYRMLAKRDQRNHRLGDAVNAGCLYLEVFRLRHSSDCCARCDAETEGDTDTRA